MQLHAAMRLKHRAMIRRAIRVENPTGNDNLYDYGPEEPIELTLIAPSEGKMIGYFRTDVAINDRVFSIVDNEGNPATQANTNGFQIVSLRPTLDTFGRKYGVACALGSMDESSRIPLQDLVL